MIRTLQTLFVEQTSPDEILTFLVAGGAVALSLGFLVYALLITVLWMWRGRGNVSLLALLFPSWARLRANAADYALAGATACLLLLTVAARYNVVQSVLAQPVCALTGERIRGILPLELPGTEELVAAGASQEEARRAERDLSGGTNPEQCRASTGSATRVTVGPLVRSLLTAGLPENANALLKATVVSLPDDSRAPFPKPNHLLLIALLALLAYPSWFAWQRIARSRTATPGDPDYGTIARRLAVPALCIPLLLVSAAGLGDEERIRRSAGAAALLDRPDSAEAMPWVEELVARQARVLAEAMPPDEVTEAVQGLTVADSVRAAAIESQYTRLTQLENSLTGAVRRLDRALDTLDILAQRVRADSAFSRRQRDGLADRFALLDGDINTVAGRVDSLGRAVDAHDDELAELAELPLGVQAAQDSIRALELRLQSLAQQLPDTGLLLVSLPTPAAYEVHADSGRGPVRARGEQVGLHELPPDTYLVVVPNTAYGPDEAVVRRGRAITVRPSAPVIR